jgi:hypothetical protein
MMNLVMRWLACCLFAVSVLTAAAESRAEPRIDMVVLTDGGPNISRSREWYDLLVAARVAHVQVKQANGEKVDIETGGTAENPTYRVTGLLNAKNELVVPGGKFTSRDRAGVEKWLAVLRTEGVARAKGAPRLAFGYGPQQLATIMADLGRPIDVSTKELTLRQLLERAGAKLTVPLLADGAIAAKLTSSEKIGDEFQGIATGTTLACLLARKGMVLAPQLSEKREPQYRIAAAATESWPIGWPLKKAEKDVAPAMFEIVNAEIDDIPLTQLLEVVSDRVKLPFVIDRPALRAQDIDLAKHVSLPAGQSMYAIVLRKTLFQLRLKYELRADDADRPLVWITTSIKPRSADDTP